MREVWKTFRRRWLLIGIVLIATGIPIANEAARRVSASLLGSLVDGTATVQKVRLGLCNVCVEQVRIWSPNCDQPVFAVKKVAVKLSLIDGFRTGIWANKIVVDQPEIQLHFDEIGKLITNRPTIESEQTPKPIATLPFRSVEINHALLAIHQIGRESIRVADVRISVNGDGTNYDGSVQVPSLFAGHVEIRSRFDIENQNANTQIRVVGLKATSTQLVRLPLVPPSVNTHPWVAAATVEVQQNGSIAELHDLAVQATLRELHVSMVERPDILHASGECRVLKGRVESEVAGSVVGGTFDLASVVETGETPSAELNLGYQGLKTAGLPMGLLPKEVVGELAGQVEITSSYTGSLLQLVGRANAQVINTNTFGVAIAPTKIRLNVDGGIDLSEASARSHGTITASIVSDGVSLEQLAGTGLSPPPSAKPQAAITRTPTPKLPSFVEPSGRVRAAANIRIPIATLDDPSTYFAEGVLDATGVVLNDVRVQNGQGSFSINDNAVSANFADIRLVDQQSGQESSVSAIVNTSIDVKSQVRAEVRVNRLSAATLGRLAEVKDRRIDGDILAHVLAFCPSKRLTNPLMWEGNAVVQARSIRVDEQLIAHCEASCSLERGLVNLDRLEGELAGGSLDCAGTLMLQPPFTFRFDGAMDDVSIGTFGTIAGRSPSEVVGLVDASIQGAGDLSSNQWRASGTMVGSQLRFGSRNFDDTQLHFHADPERIVVHTPQRGFLGGDLGFEIDQLKTVTGRVTDLPVAAIGRLTGQTERIDGLVSCAFRANLTTDLSRLNAVAAVNSAGISLRNANLKEIRVDADLKDGLLAVEGQSLGLGGKLSVRADADVNRFIELSPDERAAISKLPVNAVATVDDVKLAELWPIIGQRAQLRDLRGRLSGTFERGAAEREQGKIAVGELRLRDLRWDNVTWSNQLHASVAVGDRLAEVRQLSGSFAGGRINGSGTVALDGLNNGSFEFSAAQISLRKALVPIARRGELANGLVSVRINGRLGSRPTGRALVSMDRGAAGPIALARLRVPIDWSLDPRAKSAQWRTTNATVELGGGRVVTNAEGRWNGKLDLTMTTSARRVDTGRILVGRTTPGSGYLDGTLRLKAKRAFGANDFTGTFDATLSDASSLQFPVVSDLTKFLKTIHSTSSFDESRIQGRLGNGIVHIDRVALAAANAQIFAEGTATLQGRLNLQVMAKTGETGPADKLLKLVDSPLLMAAPTPIGLVAKANAALKDRVVHLRIGGTAARPVIRLEPGRQIGQEAIKFFMNQAIAFRNTNDEFSFK